MTDPFADTDNPVVAQGLVPGVVVRLSKTAGGARTYTVGMTIPVDAVPDAVIDALFEIDRLMAERIEKPVPKVRGESITAQLRRSVIVETLRHHKHSGAGVPPQWATTAEIMAAAKLTHRSQVVTDLKALVDAGQVEYQRGKGGNYPSRYRLAQKGGKA